MAVKKLSDEMRPFFSIITTPAKGTIAPIHDRMPFILSEAHEYFWLTADFSVDMLSPSLEELIAKKV